ncbi:MAG TPA: thioredoxin domain-containing protein [Candidatus Paceibacterota bacterium]|jgi:protein-disulfide isomerase|nr:thioredoxin domain-containing protein [Candidatus Paceibacterota bacterium]
MENKSIFKDTSFYIALAILISGILISAAIYFSNFQSKTTTTNTQPVAVESEEPQLKVDANNIDTANDPILGDPNAPLTMVYWYDFQCPFCGKFEIETLPGLIDKYVNNSQMKIVFKDYAFLGPDSQDASLVSNAIWELYPQDYFAWQEAMMTSQDEENGGFGNMESILAMIKEKFPQMDTAKIQETINNKKADYEAEILADTQEGQDNGIQGTPGFIIGTQAVYGAYPLENFVSIIDSELNK